jgi:hypothetical protein
VKELNGGVPFEAEIEDWADLQSLIDGALQVARLAEPAYLFRGQADSSWTLSPSLTRAVPTTFDEVATREQETTATREFQAQAHQFLGAAELPPSRAHLLNSWELMQHNGAATRLFDWTESPYVATYFAVTGHIGVSGALWVVHAQTILQYMDKQYPNANYTDKPESQNAVLRGAAWPPALTFFAPYLETDRMGAQRTHFSVSPRAHCDHRDLIAPAVQAGKTFTTFAKVLIPAALKLEFQKRLRHINVTARTLFPGSDGLGRSITELIYLRTR